MAALPANPTLPGPDGTYPAGRPRTYTPEPPTPEQLLNLADRAERSGLPAAEAARLRDGIRRLADRDARVTLLAASLANSPGLMTRHTAAWKIHTAQNATT